MCSVDQANLISEILLPLPHECYHYCLALIGLFSTGDINFFLASAFFTRIYGCILCVCSLMHTPMEARGWYQISIILYLTLKIFTYYSFVCV